MFQTNFVFSIMNQLCDFKNNNLDNLAYNEGSNQIKLLIKYWTQNGNSTEGINRNWIGIITLVHVCRLESIFRKAIASTNIIH